MGVMYLNRIRERHLFGRVDTLSKFHCENVMKKCINMALNLPDFSYREKDGKYVHIKHFQFKWGTFVLLNTPQIRSKLFSVLSGIISLSFRLSVFKTRKFINIFEIKKKTPHQ